MSKIILGSAQFGLNYGINNEKGKVQFNEAIRVFDFALENGIRTIDTAALYGNAHEVIGEYHKIAGGQKFDIITKFPHTFDIQNANKIIDSYLIQLGVDAIEVLMFHSFKSLKERLDELVDGLDNLKGKKVKKIGVSIYTNEDFEAASEISFIDVIQFPYNLLDNWSLRGEHMKKAKARNKTLHARSVFLQGLFFMPLNPNNKVVSALLNELTVLKKIATENCQSIESIALNYVHNNEYIDALIFGVDNLEHLKKNLLSINSLDKKLISEINNIKITNFDLINPSKW